MPTSRNNTVTRRTFVARTLACGAALAAPAIMAKENAVFRAGEAHVDTTPPKDIELAGFHYPVGGTPRYIKGIRQPSSVRALVLEHGESRVALLSLDIAAVSDAMARRVQQAVAAKTGIPAENVRLCATHTHSMPTFAYWRQWGTIPETYMKQVEQRALEAVLRAEADCSEAVLFAGSQRANGGNFNRTVKSSKTDADWAAEASDDERWLDTLLQVLYIERAKGKAGILWYHFASHPVCYNDHNAGPDWPGLVTQRIQENLGLTPSFLQGHAGDVNPGDGTKWIGEAEQSANAVSEAIEGSMNRLERVDVDALRANARTFDMPLDLARQQAWLEAYAADPEACSGGVWVDPGFAKAWYEAMRERTWKAQTHSVPVSVIHLGNVGLVFHPSELFSYYGIQVRMDSPFDHTLVTGYTDGSIGYVTDPKSYEPGDGGIYAAVTVPKIIDIPPYKPTAGRKLAAGLTAALQSLQA